jgi:uncharacterized protein
VWWWRLRSLGGGLALTVPQVVALTLPGAGTPGWMLATALLTAVAALTHLLVVPPLRYHVHRWEITEEAVYTLSGWWSREWRIAPISRVQTVDTAHGPLQQLLGLADLTVTTASARGPVRVSGLDAGVARQIARTLTSTTQAVSGDAT